MKIYSHTFTYRSRCRWCHSVPKNFNKYSVSFKNQDITPIRGINEIDLYYILSTTFMEEIFSIKDIHTKYNLSDFSCIMDAIRSNPRFHRKSPERGVNHKKIQRSYVCRCACGRSYWISYSLNPEIFPENNRKKSAK